MIKADILTVLESGHFYCALTENRKSASQLQEFPTKICIPFSIILYFGDKREDEMKKRFKIPYAVANFEEIRRDNYYFVDKTKYIEKLEAYKAPVFLRPRRFGKTLLCSILECYYDVNRADKFDALFGDTYIGKNPTEEKNSCMVLRFNFSKIATGKSIEVIEHNFTSICNSALGSFLSSYKRYFKQISFDEDKISNFLESILTVVEDNNLPPLYIIIDEYDNFTNQLIQSHNDGLYKSLTNPDSDSFLKSFFKVIKAGLESTAVRRCYITGVLPITIDDLTSGFNVAEIITLEESFTSMLGFTQSEMESYLDAVFEAYEFDREYFEVITTLLKKYYNGTDFLQLLKRCIIPLFYRFFSRNSY